MRGVLAEVASDRPASYVDLALRIYATASPSRAELAAISRAVNRMRELELVDVERGGADRRETVVLRRLPLTDEVVHRVARVIWKAPLTVMEIPPEAVAARVYGSGGLFWGVSYPQLFLVRRAFESLAVRGDLELQRSEWGAVESGIRIFPIDRDVEHALSRTRDATTYWDLAKHVHGKRSPHPSEVADVERAVERLRERGRVDFHQPNTMSARLIWIVKSAPR